MLKNTDPDVKTRFVNILLDTRIHVPRQNWYPHPCPSDTMLVVILCTVRHSFPWQLFFQCWNPYDILHWTFHTDTFCRNKHTQGKLPGHTKFLDKFWYPSRDWLGRRCSSEDPYTSGLWQVCYSSGLVRGSLLYPPSPLPLGSRGECSSIKIFLKKEKFFEKTGETLSVTWGLRTGDRKKIESIRINLRDLSLIKLKRTQTVCTEKERKRKRKREKTERKQSFFHFFQKKLTSPPTKI